MSNVTLKAVWSKDSSGVTGGGCIEIIDGYQDEYGEHVTCAGTFIFEQEDQDDVEFEVSLEATKDSDGVSFGDLDFDRSLTLSDDDEAKAFDFLKAHIFDSFKPKSMTIEQLEQAGRLLYGDQWQSALARALDVDNRTVRRWVSGESAIKDAIRDEITELLTTNQKEIGEYLADNA